MSTHEQKQAVDTKLRAGSRYFLNRNLVPPQAMEIYYSNPKLTIRSGPAESELKEVEKINAGFKFGRLDGSPNLDSDYQQASWTYRVKIEEAIANGYVEVEESEIYPLTTESVRNKLLEQQLLKPFWLPEVSDELNQDWLQSSHYGGASYFKVQAYPRCQNCQHPLTHLLQLNLSELPEGYDFPIREGLVKVYYCVDDDGDCELFNPRQNMPLPNYLGLYIPPEDIVNLVEHPEDDEDPDCYEHFAPLQITGWKYSGEEFPDEEYVTDFMKSVLSEFTEVEKYAYTFFVTPYHSDKLGGWHQSASFDELAVCKTCSEPMTLIYHLDPNAYVEYSPAAVIGRIFICPKHKEEIFFTYNYF